MSFHNREYFIINRIEIDAFRGSFPDGWKSVENFFVNSYETARRSLNDELMVFKTDKLQHGNVVAAYLTEKELTHSSYDHEQILIVMNSPEWSEPDDGAENPDAGNP